jgi:polar amino acid transport system substrate-binding protein
MTTTIPDLGIDLQSSVGILRRIFPVALLLFFASTSYASSSSQTLANIHSKGEISVGVKTDVIPFGMLDNSGTPVGLEVDLAGQIAQKLGVRLRAVGITTENRFQRLEQGSVDMIIATAGDTRERRELATVIEPNYYAGGVTVMLPPGSQLVTWENARMKTLCAIQSAYFNKPISQKYGIKLLIFRSLNDASFALRDHRCAGLLYSDTAILNLLRQPDWAGFSMLHPSDLLIPWAISIRRSEHGSEMERQLGDIVADLHRTGELLALEKKWGLPPTPFLADSRALWTARLPDGSYVCKRTSDGNWPQQCRNTSFVTSQRQASDENLSRMLNKVPGFDLSFLHDSYDRQRYIKGILLTCYLTLLPLILTLPLGYILLLMLISRYRLVRITARFFANTGRMTPPLLQMYLIYFAVCGYLASTINISIPAFMVAVACLTVYHASIVSFSLEQTLSAIEQPHQKHRVSLRTLAFLLSASSVSIRGTLTNLAKATTIASAIAIPELLSVTLSIINDQGNTFVMMNMLLLAFFVSTTLWSALIKSAENRLHQFVRESCLPR